MIPPQNTSKAAVALRTAAFAFVKQADSVDYASGDPNDRRGQRLNRALLRAAMAYGLAAAPIVSEVTEVLQDIDDGLVGRLPEVEWSSRTTPRHLPWFLSAKRC